MVEGSWENCYLSDVDDSAFGVLLEFVLFFYCFVGLAIVCDDHLVPSLETLVQKLGIPEDVAGASFMAFGSAAPEIIINAVSTIKAGTGNPEDAADSTALGIGAILGSGMIAFSVIPAACAVGAGKTLELKRRPLMRDIITYAISLMLLVLFFHDGKIQLFPDSLCLVSVYVIYIFILVTSPKIRREYRIRSGKPVRMTTFVEEAALERQRLADSGESGETAAAYVPLEGDAAAAATAEDSATAAALATAHVPSDNGVVVGAPLPAEAGSGPQITECLRKTLSILTQPVVFVCEWTCPSCEIWTPLENADEGRKLDAKNPKEWTWPITFCVAFLWVSLFSFVISAIVERWCDLLNADAGFFGMALVAIGAEIPDTIQSMTAAKRGYGALAVGNCLGSQICNICLGLGVPWTASALGGHIITVRNQRSLQTTALFQAGIVAFLFSSLIGMGVAQGTATALLTPFKGKVYFALYLVVLTILAVIAFA